MYLLSFTLDSIPLRYFSLVISPTNESKLQEIVQRVGNTFVYIPEVNKHRRCK